MTDDTKPAALFWDFAKLYVAILVAMLIALTNIWDSPQDYLGSIGSDATLMNIALAQLAAFLAGLWGYQAIHNSRRARDANGWIRTCLYLSIATGICCFCAMLFAAVLTFLSLFGSLLFFILVFVTTITAFIIRGRYFLHLITVYFLLTAHLLFWRLALRIAESV